jgi:hypothetical protein
MAKFCPSCGNGLADAAKFCPACGTQIPAAPVLQSCIQPQWIEFRDDGTFAHQFPEEGADNLVMGYFYWNGNFSVSADKIILTNVKQEYIVKTGSQDRAEKYKKSIEKIDCPFYFSNIPGFGVNPRTGSYPDGWDELTWLYIDFLPGVAGSTYVCFVKPIV